MPVRRTEKIVVDDTAVSRAFHVLSDGTQYIGRRGSKNEGLFHRFAGGTDRIVGVVDGSVGL